MQEWFVELSGHKSDLLALTRILTAPALSVVKQDGGYFLKSTDFGLLPDDDKVYTHAKSKMDVLNGIGCVYVDGFVNVGLSGDVKWSDDSGPHRSIFVEAKSVFRISASFGAVVVNGGEVVPTGLTDADKAATAAAKEEIVARALRFFSKEKNWFNLSKVLDAIGDDLSRDRKRWLEAVKAQNWVPRSEINRFSGTANNHTAGKGEARHGFDYGDPMPNPMTLGEAEQLIRTILAGWLQTKK